MSPRLRKPLCQLLNPENTKKVVKIVERHFVNRQNFFLSKGKGGRTKRKREKYVCAYSSLGEGDGVSKERRFLKCGHESRQCFSTFFGPRHHKTEKNLVVNSIFGGTPGTSSRHPCVPRHFLLGNTGSR